MPYLVALGSNLDKGNLTPLDILSLAIWQFGGMGLNVVAQSRFYQTPALPQGSGPDFVNAVVAVRSDLSVKAVLDRLQQVEAALGRDRRSRWDARVIDLDLIGFRDTVLPDAFTVRRWMDMDQELAMKVQPNELILPHPRLHERGFVLVPLAEVAPDWRHPLLDRTAAELRAALPAEAVEGIVPVDTMSQRQNVAE